MTSIHPPHPMYANTAIHFRDPFAARDSTANRLPHTHRQPRANWSSYSNNSNISRTLTPPPDMNSVSHAPQYGNNQEHGRQYNDQMPAYRAPTAQYPPYVQSDMSSRTANLKESRTSPKQQTRPAVLDTSNDNNNRSNKPNNSAIAPSFQIPKTVNDSGGSLSELAAEVSF